VSQEVTGKEIIEQKDAQIQQLQADKEQLSQENKLLKEKVDLLIRRLFGAKSEKLDVAQLELLLNQADSGKADASAEKAEAAPIITGLLKPVPRGEGKKERRERWPNDLAIEQEVIEPAEVKANREAFRCIGEEVTETLDYRRACSNAASQHRVYWLKLSLANIVITCRSTGRNKFTGIGTKSGCRVRAWFDGSAWPVSG
jgi:Transposase C of IS166 homeodomain